MKLLQSKSGHSPTHVSETFEDNHEYFVHIAKKSGKFTRATAATVSRYSKKVTRITSVVLLALTILLVGIGYEVTVNNQSADPVKEETLSLWSQRACRDAFSRHEFNNATPPQRQVQVLTASQTDNGVTDGYNCKAKVWIGFKRDPVTKVVENEGCDVLACFDTVSYTHLTLPTKRIV